MNKHIKKKAFTLIEILIVIAIISILFLVLASNVNVTSDKAKRTAVLIDLRALQYAALQVANQDKNIVNDLNLLADLLNQNLDSELTVIVDDNKLKTMARDAWSNEYELRYSCPADTNGQLQILSAGPDGNFATPDDIVTAVVCEKLAGNGTHVVIKDNVSWNDIIPDSEHMCVFNKTRKENKYLKSPGTCKSPAVYYYSCSCGEMGSETFEGLKDESVHNNIDYQYELLDDTNHTKIDFCSDCQSVVNTYSESHVFNDKTCTQCNFEKHVHSYTQQITTNENKKSDATCTSPAIYFYVCECGEKDTRTYTYGETISHNYNTTISKYPSCTQEGAYKHTCTECSTSYTEPIAKYAHSYIQENASSQYLNSNATCKMPATYFYSCTCGAVGTKTFEYGNVDSTNHQYETLIDYEIADNEQHYIKTVCKGCNSTISSIKSDHILDEHNNCTQCNNHSHIFNQQNNRYIKSDATCTTKATYYYECICGEPGEEWYEYGDINPDNHTGTLVSVGTQDIHSKYSCCSKTSNEQHNYTETVTKTATCISTGMKLHACSCGYSYTSTISVDVNNHSGAATYGTTNDVHTLYSCCGAVISTTHTYNKSVAQEKYLKSAATCQSYAVYYKSCECGAIGTTTFTSGSKAAHTLTYGGTKSVHQKCTVCGRTTSSTHSYTTQEIQASTCSLNSKTQSSCICGYSYTTTNNDRLGATDNNNDNICDDCNVPLLDNLMIFRTDGIAYLYKKDHALYSTYTGWMTKKVSLLLAPWRFDDGDLEHVIIEDGVTPISTEYWFAGNNNPSRGPENLKTIVFGDGVKNIARSTLAYCDSLESVVIKGATTIASSAIIGNPKLTSIDFGPSLTILEQSGLEDNDGLTSLTLPSTLTTIGNYAFEDCTNLKSIYIDKNVSSIGIGIFWHCESLQTISVSTSNKTYSSKGNCLIKTSSRTIVEGCPNSVIPSDGSVTAIGERSFTGLHSLKSMIIPASITSIGRMAFQNCGIETLTVLGNLTYISEPFYNCPIKTLIFGEGVTTIPKTFARGQDELTDLVLPSTLKTIEANAFNGCKALQSVVIPGSLIKIDTNAFLNCTSLTSVLFKSTRGWNVNGTLIDFSNTTNNVVLLTSTYVGNTIQRDSSYAEYPTVEADTTLDLYSWEELKQIAQLNLTAEQYETRYGIKLGQKKNDKYVLIDLDGNGYDGFVFAYDTGLNITGISTSSGYANSSMATNVNNQYNSMSTELQNAIKQITITSTYGSGSSFSTKTSSCNIFIPSHREMGGGAYLGDTTYGTILDREGTQFDFFNSTIARHSLYEDDYWTRSVYPDGSGFFWVDETGAAVTGYHNPSYEMHVVACFVIG